MEYMVLFIYYVGCIVAFLLLDYQNRDVKNVEQPMMFIVALFSWLVVVAVGIGLMVDHINKKVALENEKMVNRIISQMHFVPKGNVFNSSYKEFKHKKKK